MHVVVVGAGLVGCAVAVELLRDGHDVTVLEKAVPGAEASSAAGGILSPQAECDADGPMLQLCRAGLAHTRSFAAELRAHTGIDPELDVGGTSLVARTHGARERLRARVQWQQALGLRATVFDGDDVTTAHFADEARIHPRPYLAATSALMRARGAVVRSAVHVERIDAHAHTVWLKDGSHVQAHAVVVCAGAWTSLLSGASLRAHDVFPVRGQMLELLSTPGAVPNVMFEDHTYLVPRRDGRVVCGSTMEHVGFDKRTTHDAIADMLQVAWRLAPALIDAPLAGSWAGLRPATRDGLPVIGETRAPGVWVASGHFRNGILLASITAAVLADALGGRVPRVDISAFSPLRLAP